MKEFAACDLATPQGVTSAIQRNLSRVEEHTEPVTVVCSVGGGLVRLKHALGTKPTCLHVEPWVDARWWAGTAERALWTKDTVAFSASAPGVYTVSVGRL